ncbi:elongation factor G-like protein EF-G2 [soil metagenome]
MSSRRAGTDGAVPAPQSSDAIRNVALVGPSGGGKTTLVEHLLLAHGVINRPGSVEAGTTVSDWDAAEHRQQRSVGLSLASYVVDGVKVNLLDTPGYADYVGELRAGLRAAECALFVVSAAEALEAATRGLWAECEAVGMPRAVVMTKLDHPRADFPGALAAIRSAFGESVLPLYLPLDGGSSLVGLLSRHSARELSGVERSEVDERRATLIEAIVEESEDESLMERYLSGEEIGFDTLVDDLETAVARAGFHPVVPVSATTGVGLAALDEVIAQGFPPPEVHSMPAVFTTAGAQVRGLRCDPSGPLLAEVVKTTSDSYVGRVSLVRVFSGTLRPDTAVHVSGHSSAFRENQAGHADHDEDERTSTLSSPLGATLRVTDKGVAGDLVAVAKLSRAETGDTISDRDKPLLMEPWPLPDPQLPVAIVARTKSDEDRLGQALVRLAAEDPTLRVQNNPDTHQLVLWTMGEAHAEVLIERLHERFGVSVDRQEVLVATRETFTGPAAGVGRHVKQSGGHGQYAVCEIEVEPLGSGAGFEFVDKVVGGAVPRQYIASVQKGLVAAMQRGVGLAGRPMVDIRVTLVGGKAHSVDSSDMAFQTAAGLALRDALNHADVTVLEPVDEIEIAVDDDHVGAIMGDLAARRARVLGSEVAPDGRTVVHAEAPAVELLTYATSLRSLSHGTGSLRRRFARYDPAPG